MKRIVLVLIGVLLLVAFFVPSPASAVVNPRWRGGGGSSGGSAGGNLFEGAGGSVTWSNGLTLGDIIIDFEAASGSPFEYIVQVNEGSVLDLPSPSALPSPNTISYPPASAMFPFLPVLDSDGNIVAGAIFTWGPFTGNTAAFDLAMANPDGTTTTQRFDSDGNPVYDPVTGQPVMDPVAFEFGNSLTIDFPFSTGALVGEISVESVPEPGTLLLLVMGIGMAGVTKRMRTKARRGRTGAACLE